METYNGPSDSTSVLRLLPTTKGEVARYAKAVIQSVLNGDTNALQVHAQLKAFEKCSEAIQDAIRTNVLTEADKYSERSFDVFGVNVTKAEVGVKYNYASAGDPVWETRKSMVETATNLLKERETFLRALREPMTIVDEESGQVSEIRPPMKQSTSGIKITLS